ncbi:MAG: hypothetical protein KAR42_18125 [candidate division Zixibacteria bacterium]|nr:hypothetical protein [candidate division Zixibacteria bacterium]
MKDLKSSPSTPSGMIPPYEKESKKQARRREKRKVEEKRGIQAHAAPSLTKLTDTKTIGLIGVLTVEANSRFATIFSRRV